MKIKDHLKNSFNIYDDYLIDQYKFDFMGEYLLTNSKFFLSKNNVIYSYENKEYIFAKELDNISKDYLRDNIFPFVEYAMNNIVHINENHMSSTITLLLSSNNIDSDLKKYVQKYKKRKSYMLGIRGYASTRIIMIDKSKEEFIYNSEAKDVIKFYKEAIK